MRRHFTWGCWALLSCLWMGRAWSLSDLEKAAYLERFAPIAVEEMSAYGIPASIKLAQSIVESNWGTSRLAREANNYFGIKCKSWWDGARIALEDDDYDASGRLVPSCFRKYDSPRASFRDHSWFLLQDRYQGLFQLERSDYRSWAYGLQQCGYATNPHYARLLIRTIERWALYRYDEQGVPFVAVAAISPGSDLPDAVRATEAAQSRARASRSATFLLHWYDARAIREEVPLIEGEPILP